MFKKGQLLRSKYSRLCVVVVSWPTCRFVGSGRTVEVGHSDFTIVGNNYQAKQKCSR